MADKPIVRIENWEFCCRGDYSVLVGNLYGHPHVQDGHRAMTSPIISIDYYIVETENSFYLLHQAIE